MISSTEFMATVRSVLGSGVVVDSRSFSSGALSAEISDGNRTVVIDGTPQGEWGVSGSIGDADGGGHDEVYGSLTDAVAAVRRFLDNASNTVPDSPQETSP